MLFRSEFFNARSNRGEATVSFDARVTNVGDNDLVLPLVLVLNPNEGVTGVPEETVKTAAKLLAENRPGTIVWCMGGTQHTIGNNNTRSYCAFQLALGNIGKSGGGANIFRGHDNVQGATDFCVLSHSLPGYYGLSNGSWGHWSRVWDVDFDWVKSRFSQEKVIGDNGKETMPMNYKGIPVSRWVDGVIEDKANIGQKDNIRAMMQIGRAHV